MWKPEVDTGPVLVSRLISPAYSADEHKRCWFWGLAWKSPGEKQAGDGGYEIPLGTVASVSGVEFGFFVFVFK